jgi:hypothetical protein
MLRARFGECSCYPARAEPKPDLDPTDEPQGSASADSYYGYFGD